MKNERILEMLGQVDEKYILEAAPGTPKQKKKVNWVKWGAWGAMAACACLVFYVGSQVIYFGGSSETACDAGASVTNNGYATSDNAKQEVMSEGTMSEDVAEVPKDAADSEAPAEQESAIHEETTKVPEEKAEANLGITLTAENVTSTGLTLICTQAGGDITGELQTGSYYKLEQWVDDFIWVEVPYLVENIGWTEETYPIKEGSTMQWEINWDNIYGELPAGIYRLEKTILDVRTPGDYDTMKYYVEFTIEE